MVNQLKLQTLRGAFIQYRHWKKEDPQTMNLFIKEECIEILT